MAKAFFFNLPAHGHINPTLPLVAELVRRGESIIYFTGEKERKKIELTGAEFRPLPYDLSPFSKGPKSPDVDFLLFDCALRCLPGLIETARREKPDYILYDFVCFWGKVLAEQLQVPAITVFPNPVPDVSLLPPAFIFKLIEVLVPLGRKAKRLSLEMARIYQREPENLVQLLSENHGKVSIILTSEIFQPNRQNYGSEFRFVGPIFPKLPDLPDFSFGPLAGKRIIYISLGTVYGANRSFFKKCIQAFRNTEFGIVISTGNAIAPNEFRDLPPNFIIKSFVPQDQVLERSALFITHGGMNSIHSGLYYGVPMMVVPQGIGSDQRGNGRTIESQGVGICFTQKIFGAKVLREIALRLLADESVRGRCQALRDEFRHADGTMKAANEIISFGQQVANHSMRSVSNQGREECKTNAR